MHNMTLAAGVACDGWERCHYGEPGAGGASMCGQNGGFTHYVFSATRSGCCFQVARHGAVDSSEGWAPTYGGTNVFPLKNKKGWSMRVQQWPCAWQKGLYVVHYPHSTPCAPSMLG